MVPGAFTGAAQQRQIKAFGQDLALSHRPAIWGTSGPTSKVRTSLAAPNIEDVYTYSMRTQAPGAQPSHNLFELPCACQNLRRLNRILTRIYDQELKSAGLEITQFGLLTALATVGEANQKRLSAGFAMDSTTLTRTLGVLLKQGWVRVKQGEDRRERLFRLTEEGKRQMAMAQPHWERAERRLRKQLGDAGWKNLKETVSQTTEAGMRA